MAARKKVQKDPEGGLTAERRKAFARKEGSSLRPGVKGKADTPEKMKRKGSFFRRHFLHPRGPMRDEKGSPPRLALSAHAWGEAVPKTMSDAKKLAARGKALFDRYAKSKEASPAKRKTRKTRKTSAKRKRPSLVDNINRRQRAGTSRPKSRSTVSKESYKAMRAGWPKKKRATKTSTRRRSPSPRTKRGSRSHSQA